MAAIRHDVRVRMFLSNKWEDITSYVLQRNTITITRGRKDENTQTPPSTASLSLKNTDGRFSLRNPLGPWYGSLGQNNPIEISKRLVSWQPAQTLTDTWGSTDRNPGVLSYYWSPLDNPTNFDVAPAGATVVVPAASNIRRTSLADFTHADASAEVEYSCAVSDVTGDYLVAPGPSLRGNYYARVEISTAEVITLGISNFAGTALAAQTATGLTHTAGTKYRVRLVADGQTLAAKIWRTTDGEPRDWLVTASAVAKASGAAGVRVAAGAANTNVPVTFTVHSFVVDSMRFTGEVSSFPASSGEDGRDLYVRIEAAGILRRLGQGRAPALSTLRRGILTVNPVAYWPCEEGPDATALSSAIDGIEPMEINPAPQLPDFAAFDGFACSAPIPQINNTGWVGRIPDYDSSANQAQMRALISVPQGGVAADERLFRINMLGGTSAVWDLILQPDGNLRVNAYDAGGTNILLGGSIGFGLNGKNVRVSLELSQSGADVAWAISTLTPSAAGGGFSSTLAGRTVGKVTSIEIGGNGTFTDLACGHVTFQNSITNIFEILAQLQAYVGERAGVRMTRLSAENGIPFVYYGTTTKSFFVGAQRVDTYLNLIRNSPNAAADVDLGTVHERRSFNAVAYRDLRSIYSQASALTLSLSGKQIVAPFQPIDDDQNTRNDITLRRTDGGELRRTLDVGRKSVQLPPSGVGVYDDSPELNLNEDKYLFDVSGFLLALGTVDESRYTALRVDLDSPDTIRAALAPAVLDLDIDDRVTITGASGVFVFDDITQLMRGYTEVLGNHRHTFSFNLSPSQPYDLGTIDGGTYRVSSGTSSLTSALTEGATSFSVTTTAADDLWTTRAGAFPMNIMIGGELITLSGISGAASPQTFTVSARAANGVRKSHNAGAAVNVAPSDRWRIGLGTE